MRVLLVFLIVTCWSFAEDEGDGAAASANTPAVPAQNQGATNRVPQTGQPIIINTQPNPNQLPRVDVMDKDFFSNANKVVEEPKTSKSPKGVVRPIGKEGNYRTPEFEAICAK